MLPSTPPPSVVRRIPPPAIYDPDQSMASICSSDSSMDTAYFSHDTSILSTDIEDTFKLNDDHTISTNPIQLLQRIQHLEQQISALSAENTILTSTNNRLNQDLELYSQHTGSDANPNQSESELRKSLQFMQMELEMRDSVVGDLKSTIAQQFCDLQEPHLEVAHLKKSLRGCELDLESSRKSEQWALDELHRSQRMRGKLQQRLLELEQDKSLNEIRAVRYEAQFNAASQHAKEMAERWFSEKELLRRQLAEQAEVKHSNQLVNKTDSRNMHLVCRCSNLKFEMEQLEQENELLKNKCQTEELLRSDIERHNGRLQSEVVVLSTSLTDQTVLLNTLQDYLNRLEHSSKAERDSRTNDLHEQVKDYKSQLDALRDELNSKNLELTQLRTRHEDIVNTHERLAFQLKGTEDLLSRVRKEKETVFTQFSRLLNETITINDDSEICANSFDLCSNQSQLKMIPLCQIDLIDLSPFNIIRSLPTNEHKSSQTDFEDNQNLSVLLKVMQTEHDNKSKRYETHIRSLIHKALTHMRSQTLAEVKLGEVLAEARLDEERLRFEVKYNEKKLLSDIQSQAAMYKDKIGCFEEKILLLSNENRLLLQNLHKLRAEAPIRQYCETDDVKRLALMPVRTKLDLSLVRDVIRRANLRQVSLAPLEQGVIHLKSEVNALTSVVKMQCRHGPVSLKEELEASARF